MIDGIVYDGPTAWGFFSRKHWEKILEYKKENPDNDLLEDLPYSIWIDKYRGEIKEMDNVEGIGDFSKGLITFSREVDMEKDAKFFRFSLSYMMKTGRWCEI